MKKKLLLADDSITIQKVIQITFSHDDYIMTVVDNGDAALEKARAEHPDLILADVFMPGKNGYELCAAVRKDPALAKIPVLLLTGTFEPFDEAKARAAGANKWIAKPFESQALINCVEELLAQAPPQPVAQPAAPVVPVAASAEPSVSAVDLESDMWGSEFETELAAPLEPIPLSQPEPLSIGGADDIWGGDAFGGSGESYEMAADGGDIWGSFEEETTLNQDMFAAPAPAADDLWGGGDELLSSFAADEVGTAAPAVIPVEPLPFGDAEILEEIDLTEEVSGAEPFALDAAGVSATPSFAGVEPLPSGEEDLWGGEVAAIPVAPAQPAAAVAAQGAALSAADQLPRLNEADLERLVEKLAGAVIERLAGTILEKVAWEVVPDLAETLIKEELRKIKEDAAA